MDTPRRDDSFLNPARRWFAALAAALISVGALVGCGGGVGSGGTGTYASGTISGLGSIFVNAVRYDDSAATVVDEDELSRSNAELKLGMTVEVDAGAITTDTSGRRATATRIRFGSELLGPVTAVDTAAGRFTVLGQTVVVSTQTIFDDRLSGGLSGLRAGAGVEVYGQFDAANGWYLATRVEPRSTLSQWRIRGIVSALDNAARTLRIGSATFVWATASSIPADLAVGRIVRLPLTMALDASGRYVVSTFSTALRLPPDRPEAELKGTITSFSSSAAFSVNGIPVNASAASFPDGSAGVRLGTSVEIKGRAEAGTLIASSVSIESDAKFEARGFEFRGQLTAVDAAARTITVRGEVISTARSDLRLDNGTLADLKVGREVEVRATQPSPGQRLEATRITLK